MNNSLRYFWQFQLV